MKPTLVLSLAMAALVTDALAPVPAVATEYNYFVSSQAHLAGAAGTQWRSNLVGVNRTGNVANLTLTFLPHISGTTITRTATLAAGETREWQDVLVTLFGQPPGGTAKGSIQITSDRPVVFMARTFNQTESGTYGQFYPAIDGGQVLTPGWVGILPMLKKNAAFRSNIGILNPGAKECGIAVRLFGANGDQVGSTKRQTVGAGRYWQEDDVFVKWGAGQQENAYATVEVTSDDGGIWAYGSVVDAVTGDPTTVPLQREVGESILSDDSLTVYLGPANTVPLVLRRIPAGTFTMGSGNSEGGTAYFEGPMHQVTIAQDYYLGVYEVTQEQWQAVMGTNPSYFSTCGGTCPVESVSWDAIAGTGGFLDRLNQALGTTKFRLPTEAEWEYAARAGMPNTYPLGMFSFWVYGYGNQEAQDCGSFAAAEEYMWWCGNNSPYGPKPVGAPKFPNPWGLYNMHGNVWEWVQDWWHDTYEDAPTDGSAWIVPAGSARVMRSGSWASPAHSCRSARRSQGHPGASSGYIGFRLARSQ